MHSFNFNKYYKNVKKIVIKAGIVAKKKLNKVKITHYKEKDDLVTETDLLVEDIIFRYISKTFPEHGFNSEEKGKYQTNADYIWVLDPIDGTKYYAKGLPLYSISLALEYKGNLIQGIVYIQKEYNVQRK